MLVLVNTSVLATIDKESGSDAEAPIYQQHNGNGSRSGPGDDDIDNADPAVKPGKSESGHSIAASTDVTTVDETKSIGAAKNCAREI